MPKSYLADSIYDRLKAIQEIALDLVKEKDPNQVLKTIISKAVELMICDAGSIYVKHEDNQLMFVSAINHSVETDLEKKLVPLDYKGLAVYSFMNSKPLSINDVYNIPEGSPYNFNANFDKRSGYRTKSVLLQPLVSSRGETLGVIQLINRKNTKEEVWPSHDPNLIENFPGFNDEDISLIKTFANLAAASLENALLYENIHQLFEGFVFASVKAIESRDAPTRGHSERVAILTVDLAEHVSRSSDYGVRHIQFSDKQINEIRYAALLHDFGKIGVKEDTLLKQKKLFDYEMQRIQGRLQSFKTARKMHALEDYLNKLADNNQAPTHLDLKRIDNQINDFSDELNSYWKMILELNEPTILDEDKRELLNKIITLEFLDAHRKQQKLLDTNEAEVLSIKKGSLSDEERLEIQSHVTRTYQFLKEIPWTRDFSFVPEIAYAHHEFLNGTGYPRNLKKKDIPIQSQIMTVCDIFDALAAADRPYKKALPSERALDILGYEVQDGKIDSRLLKIFIEAKIFENPNFIKLTRNSFHTKKAA